MEGSIVYRLGRDPFKVQSGVRFPVEPQAGFPIKFKMLISINSPKLTLFHQSRPSLCGHGSKRGSFILNAMKWLSVWPQQPQISNFSSSLGIFEVKKVRLSFGATRTTTEVSLIFLRT